MLKRTVTYKDYNDVERTEDLYFHFSESEILEMELSTEGGYSDMVKKMVKAKDEPSLMKVVKDFVLKAYGEKSPDGRRFIKSEELSTAFSQTEAFNKLFMELVTDADAASRFVNEVIPQKEILDKIE